MCTVPAKQGEGPRSERDKQGKGPRSDREANDTHTSSSQTGEGSEKRTRPFALFADGQDRRERRQATDPDGPCLPEVFDVFGTDAKLGVAAEGNEVSEACPLHILRERARVEYEYNDNIGRGKKAPHAAC